MPTVSIEGQPRKYEVEAGENLFSELNNQKVELPHGCLAGSCGACRIIVTKGEDNLAPADQMEQDTVKSIIVNYRRLHGPKYLKNDTVRLSCRAIVNGDVTIKILD